MKKNIIFMLISIICFVLGSLFTYILAYHNNNFSNEQTNSDYSKIKFLSGEYYNKIWNQDDVQNIFDSNCVPDMESAVQIANVIFYNKQKQGLFKEYKLQSVFYDESDDVWIISFWKPYDEKNCLITVGSDFNIAISQRNGEVLTYWVGE